MAGVDAKRPVGLALLACFFPDSADLDATAAWCHPEDAKDRRCLRWDNCTGILSLYLRLAQNLRWSLFVAGFNASPSINILNGLVEGVESTSGVERNVTIVIGKLVQNGPFGMDQTKVDQVFQFGLVQNQAVSIDNLTAAVDPARFGWS
ncbi:MULTISPECIES: hypothetical protein [unclassified Phyllobacterium]|uniref:hypothetical protein n=1 Tax=unclassified Phyllobacterium TaxID=2638441 RepID=UPI003012C21A